MIKTKKKVYTKKALEEARHLSIGRILYYLYWTQHKSWKEVAAKLDVPQRTVERWAEESGIESRSYAHEMMLPTKTKAEIEKEYGKPLNEVLFYLMLKRAVKRLPKKAILKKPDKKVMQKKSILRLSWSLRQVKILKRMWLGGSFKKEIAKTLKRSITAIYRKGEKLGLPRKYVTPHRMKLEPAEIVPTEGVRKCHNCLEEIKLSENGLDKDYRGATRQKKWFFWHLPGQCPKNPNTHANLLHEDSPNDDDSGRPY